MFTEIINELYNMAPYVHYISFGLLVLAGFNLPVSEDLVYITSAAIASTIIPENTVKIFIGCFLGAYISDIIAFYIGKLAGNKLLETKLFKKIIPEQKILMLKVYFKRYGGKTLFFGRFIPFGVRNAIFMTSGLVHMRITKFLLIDLASLSITSCILFYLGYQFGQKLDTIKEYVGQYKIVLAVIVIFLITFHLIRRHRAKLNIKKQHN